jgi:hypothetical protein
MKYTTYNPATGEIISIMEITNDQTFQDNLSDKHFIEGSYNGLDFYIDLNSKLPVKKPTQPSLNHEWNFNTQSWELNLAQETITQRQQRDQLLSAIDRINPIWYASLTQEQQTELASYRQSLLDVPQQAGFPVTIEWPTKPAWL